MLTIVKVVTNGWKAPVTIQTVTIVDSGQKRPVKMAHKHKHNIKEKHYGNK